MPLMRGSTRTGDRLSTAGRDVPLVTGDRLDKTGPWLTPTATPEDTAEGGGATRAWSGPETSLLVVALLQAAFLLGETGCGLLVRGTPGSSTFGPWVEAFATFASLTSIYTPPRPKPTAGVLGTPGRPATRERVARR